MMQKNNSAELSNYLMHPIPCPSAWILRLLSKYAETSLFILIGRSRVWEVWRYKADRNTVPHIY